MLVAIIAILPISILREAIHNRAVAVEILRAALSIMMATTGYVNMRSFRKLRDGH